MSRVGLGRVEKINVIRGLGRVGKIYGFRGLGWVGLSYTRVGLGWVETWVGWVGSGPYARHHLKIRGHSFLCYFAFFLPKLLYVHIFSVKRFVSVY